MFSIGADKLLQTPMASQLSGALSESERHQVLYEWNQTSRDYPRDKCVHQLFEDQVARTPDAVAVVFEDQSLTYAELNARANQLAHHLQSLGVGPEVLVGLCVERSLDMIVGLLGILKAGGAYVPLDPKLPEERLRFLITDARLAIILTERIHAPLLQRALSGTEKATTASSVQDRPFVAQACCLSFINDTQSDSPVPSPPRSGEKVAEGRMRGLDSHQPTATSPAYVNYTSGSTGEPRGVLVPHRAVVRLVKSANYVSLTEADTLLQLSTLSFDASTFEIWGALLNGARLVLMPPDQPSLTEIGSAICRYHVTTLWLTAGLFHLMVDEQLDALRPLRQLLAGGDVLSVDHVIRAKHALPNCRLINGYGPTENTTFTCCYTVGDESDLIPSVPIGRPVSNTQVYLLDLSLQPVPLGVVGELYAGGDGLACGYLNAPELTAEKFIPNPFSDDPDARLYRTGDLARYRPDGNIEFLGRTDHQVKIRGFRIELGEIEAALRGLPGIRDVAVLALEQAASDKRLVAWLVTAELTGTGSSTQQDPASLSAAELRSSLSKTLPEYMIPTQFIVLPELPLTPNGKLDRQALANHNGIEVTSGGAYEAPQNELERQVATIWQSVLNCEQVGIRDNFFELGGHSLLAARLVSEMQKWLNCQLSIADVFQSPTVESLARRISDRDWTPRWTSLVPLQTKGQELPLFCMHGWGGSAYGFVQLARQLSPDRPVYALQAIGLDGTSPKHATVEEMARHYASEIRTVQPQGPYHLAGQSLGGWIAYAVAQELNAQGEKVDMLALLDTQASCNVGWSVFLRIAAPALFKKAGYHLRNALKQPAGKRWQYLQRRLKWLRMHLPGTRREMPTESNSVDLAPSVEQGRIVDYFDAAVVNYRPKPWIGNVVVFAGDDVKEFPHEKFWKCFVRGKVDFYRVAGTHHSLISEENVAAFAVLFRRLLAES